MSISVAARSEALVCGRSLAAIAGSKPAEGKDVCLLCVFVYCQAQFSVLG
jgi:hypothetical protein